MSDTHLRARLKLFVLNHLIRALLSGELSILRFFQMLRKQMILSSQFRDARYSQVGPKIFIDPFVPYFPSSYCTKLFNNNVSNVYPPKPNFAQISITNRCPCRCIHCHVQNTQQKDLPTEAIHRAICQIAEADFPLIFFVGGEPMSRFTDLLEFVALARQQMDTRIFTSGVGSSPERLQRLRRAGLEGICVSLDHYVEAIHNRKRKHPAAFRSACDTIREASSLGFYVSVVCCTTSSMATSGEAFKVVDLAESLGAHSIQLNEIRPVGSALETDDGDLFLTDRDKQTLIEYYRSTNRSRRKIAIVMPWYNEEPHKFGCTATSAQQVYIDAKGNVQPCPLLKVGLGNISDQDFQEVWARFRSECGHPVRECIVHRLAGELRQSPTLPLPVERSYELWPQVCGMRPPDTYERIHGIRRQVDASAGKAGLFRIFGLKVAGTFRVPSAFVLNRVSSSSYGTRSVPTTLPEHATEKCSGTYPGNCKYNLELREGVDFRVKRGHWLPKRLGIEYIAFAKTLYCRQDRAEVPRHEFLHIAQFSRYGVFRVTLHYLFHVARNYCRYGNFAEAFRRVPLEVEAVDYEAGHLPI
jgi:MoaA/NifB/PqqE/SkfB family radical SAM enzyme